MTRLSRSLALGLAAPLALAQGTIKIGVLGPMTQPQGEYHWYGAEMARDDINKAGGINVGGKKMQIELVRADTNEHQSIPDATNAIERCFREVRRRTRPMSCFTNDASCERIIYAVFSHLNQNWEARPSQSPHKP